MATFTMPSVAVLLYPWLAFLTAGVALYVIATICGLVALLVPPLELIPFANTVTGIALSHDGLLVVLGLGFCVSALALLFLVPGG